MKHAKKINKFVIDRNVWMRQPAETSSSLLDPDTNKRCCLGIYGKACGLSDEVMAGRSMPCQINKRAKQFPKFLLELCDDGSVDSSLSAQRLMGINDSPYTIDFYKEEQIAEIFAKHGVEVEFIN